MYTCIDYIRALQIESMENQMKKGKNVMQVKAKKVVEIFRKKNFFCARLSEKGKCCMLYKLYIKAVNPKKEFQTFFFSKQNVTQSCGFFFIHTQRFVCENFN